MNQIVKVEWIAILKHLQKKKIRGILHKKPLEIIEDIITWCSEEGDVVLDPYLGSGSIAVASKNLKR